eukprot:TRINITY_DN2512_c0_g1_i13.p1 TRINITY_DN2512_c0_g1~~TRINITY_DN2512_c0_g1_i13.p1  ORF type:complete len:386 (-),score=77.94 TRINITY_DN2512_c0_g1_i13:1234-2391(-)
MTNRSRNIGLNIKTTFTVATTNPSRILNKDATRILTDKRTSIPGSPSKKESKPSCNSKKNLENKKSYKVPTKKEIVKKDLKIKSTKNLKPLAKDTSNTRLKKPNADQIHSMKDLSYCFSLISPSAQTGEKIVIVESIIPDADDTPDSAGTEDELSMIKEEDKTRTDAVLGQVLPSVASYLPSEERRALAMASRCTLQAFLRKSLEDIDAKVKETGEEVSDAGVENSQGEIEKEFNISRESIGKLEKCKEEHILGADEDTRSMLSFLIAAAEGKESPWESVLSLLLEKVRGEGLGEYILKAFIKFKPTNDTVCLMKKYSEKNPRWKEALACNGDSTEECLLPAITELIRYFEAISSDYKPEQAKFQCLVEIRERVSSIAKSMNLKI